MLVTLKEILELCEARSCAVGSFNTPNLEAIMAVIGAAEELDVPVIIQHAEVHEEMMPFEVIGPIRLEMARKSKVPVAVHVDPVSYTHLHIASFCRSRNAIYGCRIERRNCWLDNC